MDLAGESGQSLQDKLELSRQRIASILQDFAPQEILLAWSGGKDSTLLLAIFLQLWHQELQAVSAPKVVSLDTGCKFPEVVQFRDEIAKRWGLQLLLAKPEVDLDSYPLARDPVQCCLDLKIRPLQKVIQKQGARVLLTGTRHDEAPSRQEKPWLEEKDSATVAAGAISGATAGRSGRW